MHAHFDCFAGISGDMVLGAFIDLGVPVDWLVGEIRSIPLTGFEIETNPIIRHGIGAQRIRVIESADPQERSWAAIRALIDASPLSGAVKSRGLSIFKRLAIAEGGIHHMEPEKVHFHEIGGVDALVDIIGTALCVEYLRIESVSASAIALGRGLVQCRHGTLPLPSPATVAILKDIPVYGTEIEYELTTPTGAAIVATLAQDFGVMPELTVKQVGYGAGKRDHKTLPNLLRIIIGDAGPVHQGGQSAGLRRESIVVVEATIDDMNPELYGYLMERLFKDGAVDVNFIPIYMKKNRPGTQVQVLCRPQKRQALVRRLMTETTSLGVRFYTMQRETLFRETFDFKSSFGPIQAKRIIGPDDENRLIPEYESCRKIAIEHDQPIRKVYEKLQQELTAYLETSDPGKMPGGNHFT